MRGVVAEIIIHTIYFVNRFRGFAFLTPRNFAISIGLSGQSYNSVSIAVLMNLTLREYRQILGERRGRYVQKWHFIC